MKIGIRAIVAAIIAALAIGIAAAQTKQRTITVEDGRQLVYRSLQAEGFIHLRLAVDDYKVASLPGFYFFEVRYGTNPNGSSTVGHYAVEETTGEVWDAVTCAHYASPTLRKMQQDLRRRISLTDDDRRRVQKHGPFCVGSEKDNLVPMTRVSQ
jgi:hypothetical protein